MDMGKQKNKNIKDCTKEKQNKKTDPINYQDFL